MSRISTSTQLCSVPNTISKIYLFFSQIIKNIHISQMYNKTFWKIVLYQKTMIRVFFQVQLPERIVIYEQRSNEGMLYKVKEKIPLKAECSLLVVTSNALLMCQDTKLQMIGYNSPTSWRVPASIRYVKVAFIAKKEVLLLGLSNGQVKIFYSSLSEIGWVSVLWWCLS